jgi:hypothetical protein
MWFFADLSHFSWLLWRIISYIVYWFAWVMAVRAIIGFAVTLPEEDGPTASGVAFVSLAVAIWLFGGYWFRRWVTAVRRIWPWSTLAREMKAREKAARVAS